MGEHKVNPIANLAGKRLLKDREKAEESVRSIKLDPNAYVDYIRKNSPAMVCNKCGFGYFIQTFEFHQVPATLHPHGKESPFFIPGTWMCPKCGTHQRPEDMTVLSQPRDMEPKTEEKEPEETPKQEPARRKYLKTHCSKCGLELFELDGEVKCAMGCYSEEEEE